MNRYLKTKSLLKSPELVIHPSGLVYLACASSPESRLFWSPAGDYLNATAVRARDSDDYVATYDHQSHEITKLSVVGLNDPRGLNLHGMDVVVDEHDPNLLWVYLVNHRPPLDALVDAHKVGADSVIEVFKTQLGANSMEWVRTFMDPSIIVTPNDVAGGTNGKEVWFTNDRQSRIGIVSTLVW